ncbi:MAG: cation transporter [Methanoregula sp.]|nr:cation transporter [Methanoregula sp.]
MTSDSEREWRTALYLEYFTVIYNVFEAAASIVFGTFAGSIALVGFGLDSVVESLSGVILIWRLGRHDQVPPEEEERIELLAQRLVAITFFLLGAYVLIESIRKLISAEIPEPSPVGMIIAVLSIIIMPVLAWKKRVIGTAIGSKALLADAKETIACAFLSTALLAGLLANYLFGFWQADPLVGFVIVFYLFREGYEGWTGSCCCDE